MIDDLRSSVRYLRVHWRFAATAVVVLAVGLATADTFFTILNAICLRGVPARDAAHIVYINTIDQQQHQGALSLLDFEYLRESDRSLSEFAAYASGTMVVSGDEHAAERVTGAYVSSGTFRLLGVTPIVGSDFQPSDDQVGAPATVVIGASVWRARYGSDAAVIGRVIRVNSIPSRVVGVVPDRAGFPGNEAIWQALSAWPGRSHSNGRLAVMARLRADASLLAANTELLSLSERRPDPQRSTLRFVATPINDRFGNAKQPAWIQFMTAGMFVLFVSCANVGSLLLMHGVNRSREIGVRLCLGGSRWRIVRTLLAESAIVAVCGGLLGLTLSVASARALGRMIPPDTLPYWMTFTLDIRVASVLAAICAAAALTFGILPALGASKVAPAALLQGGSRTGSTRSRRWTSLLVATQFALSLVLMAQVVLTVRGLHTSDGSRSLPSPDHVVTARLSLPASGYPSPVQRASFYKELERLVGESSDIASFAIATDLPWGGAEQHKLLFNRLEVGGERLPPVWTVAVSQHYFDVLGMPIVAGRALDDRDNAPRPRTAVVNERFVELYAGGKFPLGVTLQLDPDDTARGEPLTIVGIAQNIRQRAVLDNISTQAQRTVPQIDPMVYLPLTSAAPSSAAILARGYAEPSSVAATLRERVRQLNPDVPIYRTGTLDEMIDQVRWNEHVSYVLICVITLIALVLAGVGLYAVLGHSVAQRVREFGIRVALGSGPGRTGLSAVYPGVIQVVVGLCVGLLCTVVWDRIFSRPVGGVRLADTQGLFWSAAAMLAIAVLACAPSALRAAHIAPADALRVD